MAFVFRRRVQLFPGLGVNLSKSGPSFTMGVRGAHVTVGPRGVRRTLGIPGSGAYWTSTSGHHTGVHSHAAGASPRAASFMDGVYQVIGLVVVLAIVRACMEAGR